MQLTRHAADKLQTYGTEGKRLKGWHHALNSGMDILDVTSGAEGLTLRWEGRAWVVILREDVSKVVTTYPSDERTVNDRLGGGRCRFLSN